MAKRAIFDKKNILVVGGAGFIGSHLCDELVGENKVICLDNFLTGQEDNISHLYQDPNFEFINHDITKPVDLEKEPSLKTLRVEFQGVQEIYFLASPTSPRNYLEKPIETMQVNSLGLVNCLELAAKYKAKFVYVSGPAVYGHDGIKGPVTEDFIGTVDQLGTRGCYSESLRFGEALVNNYRIQYDLDTKIVRAFNIYGPRMKLSDGRMVPEFIKRALDNEEIIIYGDKKSVGSYCYVMDVTKALTKIMDDGNSGPFNVGSDWQTKFSEVAQKVVELTGSSSKISFSEMDSSMATQLIPVIAKVKDQLGWFPIVLLEEGLKETIDYLNAQQDVLSPEQLN
jgi:nucleoside-diphosphate-sugar epimerase